MRVAVIAFVATAACSSSAPSRQHVAVANLGFDVPAEWQGTNTDRRDLFESMWTPEDNDRKESITVIRSERAAAVAGTGAATLERLLVAAQVPGAHLSPVRPVVTAQGLSGARVEVDFFPPGMRVGYHRVHVVLLDGTSLIHVMYTARSPEATLQTLDMVLGSLREESQS